MRLWAWWKEIERQYTDPWLLAYFPGFDPESIKVVKKERETSDGDERVILNVHDETIIIEKKNRQGRLFLFMLYWEGDNMIVCRSVVNVAKALMTTTITLKYRKGELQNDSDNSNRP